MKYLPLSPPIGDNVIGDQFLRNNLPLEVGQISCIFLEGIFIFYAYLVQLLIINIHTEWTIILPNKQHWRTPWRDTRSDKTLIQQVLKQIIQLFQFNLSHSIKRNRDRLVIRKKVNLKIDFHFAGTSSKSSGKTFTNSFPTRTDSKYEFCTPYPSPTLYGRFVSSWSFSYILG